MSLKVSLVETPQREVSGASSDRKFDYQKDWAIYKMIQLYQKNIDFAICLEYHDDVIILDSCENPNNVDFYQVKTRNQPIDFSFLIASGKSSILTKLMTNIIKFTGNVKSINIVSNATYHLKLKDGSKSHVDYNICCSELHTDEKNKIQKIITNYFSTTKSNFTAIEGKLHFLKPPMDEKGSRRYILGYLNDLLKGMKYSLSPDKLYDTLFMEFRKKTQEDPREVKSYDDLMTKKSITFQYCDETIKIFTINLNRDKKIKEQTLSLISEYCRFSQRIMFKRVYQDYRVNQSDEKFQLQLDSVLSTLDNMDEDNYEVEVFLNKFKTKYNKPLDNKSQCLIICMFLHELAKKEIEYEI